MPVLYRASLGYLLRHPWQLALALLGIGIGVAVMVAVDLANASSERAFRLSMDALNGRTTHQIVGGPAGLDESLYVELRTVHGIRHVAPVVDGEISAGSIALSVLGVDVFAERGFRGYLSASPSGDSASEQTHGGADSDDTDLRTTINRLLTVPGSVVMTAATADALAVKPGASFTITANGRSRQASLAGYLGSENGAVLDNVVLTDIANAQVWFDTPGRLSRIDVRIEAGSGLQSRLEALLPAGVDLLPSDARSGAGPQLTSAFLTNLTAMSLLAMLVGVFLIYNSVGFAVVQRRGLIGVLRALGLTRGEAFRLILYEGIALGILGSVLGLAAGIWLGDKLLVLVAQSINDLYFRLNVTDVTVSTGALLKGAAAGITATLIAATIPAMEASGYRPSLALRRSVLESRSGKITPLLMVTGATIILAACLVLTLSGQSLIAGLVALFMLILGCAFCIPLIVRLVSPGLAKLANRIGGTPARMAVDGIRAALSRTGVAVVALAVAVSATVGVTVMVDSFRLAVSDWLSDSLRSDIYVGVPSGSLDSGLIEELVGVDGVKDYSTTRRVWLESGSGRTRVIALSMAPESYAGTQLTDASPEDVWPEFDTGDTVLVSEPYAYRQQTGAGERLTLRTTDGPVEFRVLATYRSYDADQGAIIMSRQTYDRHWQDRAVDSLGLYLRDDASADAVADRLRTVSEGRQAIRIADNASLKQLSLDIFDRTFVITNVLYWLAVGVAVTGILGAMLALQLERARELAILRALGMTPGQLGAMVTLQSSVLGLLSGLAAVPLGLVMAWVLIDVINRRSFGWEMSISIDPSVVVSSVVLATGAAFVAGLYPAFRAARSSPAAAMREE